MSSKYAMTAKEAQPTIWVMRNDKGEIVEHEQTQDERTALQIPPKGEYRLRLKAFAEPFEMPRSPEFGGGMQTMTRLLLEVAAGPAQGKRTTLLCSWSIGPRSNLGKVFKATTGQVVENGVEYDPVDMLEGEFTAYLQPSKNLNEDGKPKGTDCSWDTVSAVGETAATGTDDAWS